MIGERASKLWGRIEIIGDLAVIKRPPNSSVSVEEMRLIAEALLARLPAVRGVWLAASPVAGPYKTREFLHLAGENRSETIYKEHGCRFKVDIRKVFLTPRLSYEHLRIARLVREGEIAINMFAGIGTFSIIMAKLSKPRLVHSIDINPYAYELMKENIIMNKVGHIVVPHLGDAAEVSASLGKIADRVLMPLPALALEYLPSALSALRGQRGYLHVYLHVDEKEFPEGPAKEIRERVEREGWRVGDMRARVVRDVGPRLLQVVYDVEAWRA